MKIIDEKGTLFGKINIVDLLAILVIVLVGAVLAVKFLGGNGGVVADNSTLIYTVRVSEVDQSTYESVCQFVDSKAGLKDQLLTSNGLEDGYIVDVTATEHIPSPGDTVGGDTLDLIFTVETQVSGLRNAVGTQEVRIGKTHILKSVHIEFEETTILSCRWE